MLVVWILKQNHLDLQQLFVWFLLLKIYSYKCLSEVVVLLRCLEFYVCRKHIYKSS